MSKTLSIALSDSAKAVVTLETRGAKIVYANYVTENGVTLDNVGDHVAALADLAVEMKALDADDKVDVKRFKNRVRNGLNYALGKESGSGGKSDKYITAEGLKAESWDVFVKKAYAEWTAANESK